MERRINELKDCNEEEMRHILGSIDVEILLTAFWKEIKRLKQLENDIQNLIRR